MVSIFWLIIQSNVFLNVSGVSPSRPNTKLALTIMPRLCNSLISLSNSSRLFCILWTLDKDWGLILSKPINKLWQPVSFIKSINSGYCPIFIVTAAFQFNFKGLIRSKNCLVQEILPIKLSSINIICFVPKLLISANTSSILRFIYWWVPELL